jgi:hypothetical protein
MIDEKEDPRSERATERVMDEEGDLRKGILPKTRSLARREPSPQRKIVDEND